MYTNSNIIITTSKQDSSFLVYDIKAKKIIFDKERIEDFNDLFLRARKDLLIDHLEFIEILMIFLLHLIQKLDILMLKLIHTKDCLIM